MMQADKIKVQNSLSKDRLKDETEKTKRRAFPRGQRIEKSKNYF